MNKRTNEIISQIRTLLDELESRTKEPMLTKGKIIETGSKKATGCVGAIQGLIEEDFFEKQKNASLVVEKLKEEGQPYDKHLVSMNLLNLVKPPKRILRRIKEDNQWYYIIRK